MPDSGAKLIIFDFDGVLADSFDAFYQLNKAAFDHVGLKLTPTIYQGFFNDNIHASFRTFIKNDEKYQIFKKYRQDRLAAAYAKVKLFSSAPTLVKELGRHYNLAICSSTPRKLIAKLLTKNYLNKNFLFISGNQEQSKEEALQTILKKTHAPASQALMITDTVGDVGMAKKVGLKTIAVTWGFHSRAVLKKAKPYKIALHLQSLKDLLVAN